MLDAVLNGPGEADPRIFHFQNLLLHAVTCALVYLLLRRFTQDVAIALVLAALYAVHPANVESVSWISQRKTVLATPLALGAILAYLHHAETRGRAWFALSIGLYLLATLAKPTIILLPFLLPLFDFWPLGRSVSSQFSSKWPFALIMIGMGWVAVVSQSSSVATLAIPDLSSVHVLQKWVALLSYNLTLYVGNIFWPLYLSPFRDAPQSLSLTHGPVLLSCLVTAALGAIWVWSIRRSKPLFVGLTAFGITLGPALGPLRFFDSCVADRFLYFPIIFLLLPAAAAILAIEARSKRPIRLLRYAVLLVFVPLLILMRGQQYIWRDGRTFWTFVADTMPDYFIAHSNLGYIAIAEGKPDEAIAHSDQALKLRPDYSEAIHIRAQAMLEKGQAPQAVALLQDKIKSKLYPSNRAAYAGLAEALIVTGDAAGARAACEKVIQLGERPSLAYEYVANMALRKSRHCDLAAEFYREAVRRDERNLTARWNIGVALEAAGDKAGALREYEDTLARYEVLGRFMPQLREKAASLRARLGAATRPATG